jgi:trimeric autotransporter adhesin
MAIKIKNSTIIDDSRNLVDVGISTVTSLSIGSTEVISSSRQLKNIVSLDATTTATIESAIANAPNTFTDLNVTGITTSSGGFVGNLTGNVTGNLNSSGVNTATTVSGTTLNYTTGNITTLNSTTGNIVSGIITNISGTNLNYTGISTVTNVRSTTINNTGVGTITTLNSTTGTITNLSGTNLNTSGITTTTSLNIGADVGISTTRTTVASISPTTIDSFSSTIFRSARVQVQITQSTNYQASDVLIIHNGTTADVVEYGSVATNDYLGTFSAIVSGGNCLLRINMSSATSATVKVLSQRITI